MTCRFNQDNSSFHKYQGKSQVYTFYTHPVYFCAAAAALCVVKISIYNVLSLYPPQASIYFLLIFWQSYVDPQSTGLNFVFSDAAKTYSLTYWLGYFVTDEPPPRATCDDEENPAVTSSVT